MSDKKDLYGYEEEDIMTLEFDDGEATECGILGVFDALGKEYIALNPLGTEDVYIYGYRESDEEYETVADAFDEELDAMEYEELYAEEDAENEE